MALLALAVRLPQLGARPMHTDEATNAYIVGQLLSGQPFVYDSQDRHGPALDAMALPLVRLQGARSFGALTESQLRLSPVLAGVATVLLFSALVDSFGFASSLIAAMLFACAALPVYYNRDFIHESLFVAATFACVLSTWRAARMRSIPHAVLAAACAAIMLACKETAVIHFFALALAALLAYFWKPSENRRPLRFQPALLIAALATFFLLTIALFTWCGRNWAALPALARAVPSFFLRAGGEGHQKPFRYFLQLLTGGRSGGILCALACIGLIFALRRRDSSPHAFLAFYAAIITGIYSLIPYKTPWLALNLWLPLALLAGVAIPSLWRLAATHLPRLATVSLFAALALATALLIAHDTRQRAFVHAADEENPYAYVQTSEDLLGLPDEIEQLSRRDHLRSPRIAVIASDPWPLPWYLRKYAQVGFWQPGQPVAEADFYVTSTDAANQYAGQLRDFRPDFFGARPGVLLLLWSREPK